MKNQLRAFGAFWRQQFGRFTLITAIAFLAIAVLAYAAGRIFPSFCDSVVAYFAEMIDSINVVDDAGNVSAVGLFLNNLRAVVVGALYGLIPFLYLPALSLGANAIILGALGAYYANNGLSLLLYLSGILPHGIFELPALVLGVACGICLCSNIDHYIRKNEKGIMKPLFLNVLRVLCLLVPLLALAAVMEACVTPLVMELFM